MASNNDKLAKLEEQQAELQRKQDEIKSKIRAIKSKENAEKKKRRTHLQILFGAFTIHQAVKRAASDDGKGVINQTYLDELRKFINDDSKFQEMELLLNEDLLKYKGVKNG